MKNSHDNQADYHSLPGWQEFDEKDVRYVERFLPDDLQQLDQLERWRICMEIMREQAEASRFHLGKRLFSKMSVHVWWTLQI